MISVRTLDLVDPLYVGGERGTEKYYYTDTTVHAESPLFDAAEIRAGCVPVLRLYYNISQ